MENNLDFSHWLCRASAFHKLVTEPKTKADKDAGELSITTKNFLKDCFREAKYHRRKEFESKYTDKGLVKEEDAISLVSRVTKTLYKKNKIRVSNHYVTGEPDIHDGKQLMKCKKGGDVKCVWSLWTLPFKNDRLDISYEWQNKIYMYLTGAKEWYTHYCLVNAPDYLITAEKKGIWHKLGCPEEDEPTHKELYAEYIKKCIDVERNMIFDMPQFKKDHPYFDLDLTEWSYDIPMEERIVSFRVEWDEQDLIKIKYLVTKARNYLNELAKTN